MQIIRSRTQPAAFSGKALTVGVFAFDDVSRSGLASLDEETGGLLSEAVSGGTFTGASGTSLLLFRPDGLDVQRLLLVGLGPSGEAGPEAARRLGGVAARGFDSEHFPGVGIALPGEVCGPRGMGACVEGFLIGPGGVDAYKTESPVAGKKRKKKDPYRGAFKRLELLAQVQTGAAHRRAIKVAEAVADGMILARRLVNEPGNRMTPTNLANEARKACREVGVGVTVYDEKQIRQKGFGGLLAVSQGSEEPPRFVVMRYKPEGKKAASRKPLVLVGKGITFDSGGISIKPGKGMEEMKADMAGAAAVIGAMKAIGKLGAPRPVIGIVPSSENLPSGSALKPGDVIETYSGKTIEILNTDAEGRLILADGLAFAAEQNPAGIVDAATLTGSCVVALGHVYAGLMGNDEEWVSTVRSTAAEWGEKVWPLPMDPEYDDLVASEIADVRNTGKDQPGAITAAKLLEKFVGDCRWAHLDIAGVEWRKEGKAWVGAGPTGFGVRTFVGLALRD